MHAPVHKFCMDINGLMSAWFYPKEKHLKLTILLPQMLTPGIYDLVTMAGDYFCLDQAEIYGTDRSGFCSGSAMKMKRRTIWVC